MARLIAKTAFDDRLPMAIGDVVVTEVDPGPITFLQPLSGNVTSVSEALKRAIGTRLPEPGEALMGASARCLWSGPGQALVLGAEVEIAGAAAIDQTDGWAMARVAGPGAREVLARLTPLDLRPSAFAEGQTARTLIGHMTGQITPLAEDAFDVMVFRSTAGTLVHDLSRAMRFVAGRNRIG